MRLAPGSWPAPHDLRLAIAPLVAMVAVLSVDVGLRNLGFALLQTDDARILSWGNESVAKLDGSYASDLLAFAARRDGQPYSAVVIERQPGLRNFQAARVEANLEGLFAARGKEVYLMPPSYKYEMHGVPIPDSLRFKFHAWQDAALARQARLQPNVPAHLLKLSRSQQTRLNKRVAKAVAAHHLQTTAQSGEVKNAWRAARKKDDMADALLQALAYANAVLPEGVMG